MRALGISIYREATYVMNKQGKMGEPWGTPTETGANVRVDRGKVRLHVRSQGKDPTHCIR